ncbi:MAG: hybrid sensor histidine kinase/response regulator [Bacteroidales bacterium]|nr:MAG: hybrid sensor histidine kinase/response regulator [Bacteroidales bacterium]
MKTYTILIADDYPENVQIIIDALRESGLQHKVIRAVNGKILCDLAEKRIPDLVITDWEMPEMDGIEAIKKLKSSEATKDIPIIMCTGKMTSSKNLKMALESGAVDYIRKPIDSFELQARVYSMLKLGNSYRTIKDQNIILEQQNEEIQAQRDELQMHKTDLERLVDERTVDLKIAKEKAEESDRLKSAFLANISHEIRTPMNAIVGFSNLLIDKNIDENVKKEFIDNIIQGSNTLIKLLEDIIDISKIETGQLKVEKKPCDIFAMFDKLNILFTGRKQQLNKSNIQLVSEVNHQDKGVTIISDPYRLEQILSYLLDNAIKFTESGSIHFGYEKESSYIKFFVKDTGVGLTEKQKELIFMRFTKTSMTNEKLYQGVGLGLSICKSLVGMLGGDIWVQSEVNVGSTFYFTIPYHFENQ